MSCHQTKPWNFLLWNFVTPEPEMVETYKIGRFPAWSHRGLPRPQITPADRAHCWRRVSVEYYIQSNIGCYSARHTLSNWIKNIKCQNSIFNHTNASRSDLLPASCKSESRNASSATFSSLSSSAGHLCRGSNQLGQLPASDSLHVSRNFLNIEMEAGKKSSLVTNSTKWQTLPFDPTFSGFSAAQCIRWETVSNVLIMRKRHPSPQTRGKIPSDHCFAHWRRSWPDMLIETVLFLLLGPRLAIVQEKSFDCVDVGARRQSTSSTTQAQHFCHKYKIIRCNVDWDVGKSIKVLLKYLAHSKKRLCDQICRGLLHLWFGRRQTISLMLICRRIS